MSRGRVGTENKSQSVTSMSACEWYCTSVAYSSHNERRAASAKSLRSLTLLMKEEVVQ